jgi:hypothetical protein
MQRAQHSLAKHSQRWKHSSSLLRAKSAVVMIDFDPQMPRDEAIPTQLASSKTKFGLSGAMASA